MLQLLQSLRDGSTILEEVPSPGPSPGSLLIHSTRSLVSAGTERMLVNFGKAGWAGKIRQQPEKVRAVIGKLRAEGPFATWDAVRSKLEQPIPLGYCQAGRVLDCGGVPWARVGQRVISNGPHAEVVSVAHGMCAAIPDTVEDEAATFTPLSSIALQGINLLELKPGDRVVVIGLGLIGQLATRILRIMGCEVMGFDPSPDRCRLAAQSGVRLASNGIDPVTAALAWTGGKGVRGVLITASSQSNKLVSQAARSCGLRGKVVLVGVVGLHLNRADFYSREIMFQVSCSYGSRDPRSRHSAQSNFQQVLAWMAEARLVVMDLVTHRVLFAEAPAAYASLGDPRALGIVLEYEIRSAIGIPPARTLNIHKPSPASVALIGAGNFAVRTLLPAIASQGAKVPIAAICSERGLSAGYAARKFSAARATTDSASLYSDPNVTAIFVASRHDSHAHHAKEALAAGKHVWVEKPLALTLECVESVAAAARTTDKLLMVGFNRRFAPMAARMRRALEDRSGPFRIAVQVNAGRLEPEHWLLDPREGGGRIVGEGCHFVDLLRFLVGASISGVRCARRDLDGQDGGLFELMFSDRSVGIIDYRTDLPSHLPKETVSINGNGFEGVIHNWSRVTVSGLPEVKGPFSWWREPQKGHREAIRAFLKAVRNGGARAPIPLDEIVEVSRWTVAMQGMRADQILINPE